MAHRLKGENKSDFRNEMKAIRDSFPAEKRLNGSAKACKHAADWMELRGISVFMVYLAFRSELDMKQLIEWGWRTGRKVIVPRTNKADHSMSLHVLEDWSQLEAGAYGILEPSIEKTIQSAIEAPQAVFVPGLAFDQAGSRLGYGGGYYDRFAQKAGRFDGRKLKDQIWIGAAFEKQIVSAVPLEAHDVRMDGIVTEEQLFIIDVHEDQ